jgi:hypothetical protein
MEQKQLQMFVTASDFYTEAAKKVCQLLEGDEREEALNKIRSLTEEHCSAEQEFRLERAKKNI